MASNLKSFIQGSAVLTISNATLMAINFFMLPLYTVHLTTDELGVNDSISTLIVLFSTLLVLGLDSAYSAFFYDVEGEHYRAKVFSTIWIAMAATCVIPLILMFFSPQISVLMFGTTDYYAVICVAMGNVMFMLFAKPFQLDLRIRSKMGIFSVVTIITSAINVALSIMFVIFFNLTFWSFILAAFISNLFQFLAYKIVLKNKISFKLFDWSLLKQMLKYGLPLAPTTIAYWLISMASTLFLLKFYSTTEVGIYGIGNRFANGLGAITGAIQVSYTAYAFQTVHEENARNKFVNMVNFMFIGIGLIVFTITLFSPEIVNLMTAPDFHTAYYCVPGLMFGQLAYFLATFFIYGINFTKKTVYTLIAVMSGGILSVCLNIVLIPQLGGIGASISVLACQCLVAALEYIFAERLFPCHYQIVRLSIGFFALLAISVLSMELYFPIKIAIWLGSAILLCLFFGKTLIQLKGFLPKTKKKK